MKPKNDSFPRRTRPVYSAVAQTEVDLMRCTDFIRTTVSLFFYLSFVPSRRHGNDKRRKPLSWWKELWKKSKTWKVKKKFSIFFSVLVHEGRDPRRCSRRPENKGMGSQCKPELWTQSLDHRRRKNLKHLIKDIICDTFGRPAGKWWQNVDFHDNSVEVIEFLPVYFGFCEIIYSYWS